VSGKLTKTLGFYEATLGAKRVMLLDLGFLGDSIHLLPALWILRQAYPEAELNVMVSEHVTKIMEVAPYVDRVWGYPRFPRGPKWYQDFGRIRRLRAGKFDVVVNLNGSDRSSILTGLSGARWRLGRRPRLLERDVHPHRRASLQNRTHLHPALALFEKSRLSR
jgi:ADP-heptose:LPS heptosyltransferase